MKKEDAKTLTWNLRPDAELDKRLRYVVWYERKTITKVIQEACTKKITEFEKKNGPITDGQLKEAGLI